MKKFLLAYCGPRRSRRDRASTRSRSRRRAPYTKAPAYAAPIYNWTGFYIGGHVGGAFGGDNSFNGLTLSNNDGRFLGGVQAGADYQFAPNWVVGIEGQYSWLGNNNIGALFPAGLRLQQQPARPRLGHRPRRLHLGSGAAVRQGRLCLLRQQRDPDASAACRPRSRSTAAITTATPSAPASNTCSPRTGRPRSSISITTSARAASSRPAPLIPLRQLPQRRAHREGRHELPLQLGWPGGREVLIRV